MKNFIFLALFFICIQNSNQSVEFIVNDLFVSASACSQSDGKFRFQIRGTFNGDTNLFETFEMNVETSKGKKMPAQCVPVNALGVSEFTCSIDIAHYPIKTEDIILPNKPPQTSDYTFKNWEEIIGKQNKIEKQTCLPESSNTFIPSSIEIGDCGFLDSRTITINGEWEDKSKTIVLVDYSSVEIVFDGDNVSTKCRYFKSRTPLRFECDYKGSGQIKISEQYFQTLTAVYKINSINSGKSVSKCDDDDYILDALSLGSFPFLNKILLIISLLLF